MDNISSSDDSSDGENDRLDTPPDSTDDSSDQSDTEIEEPADARATHSNEIEDEEVSEGWGDGNVFFEDKSEPLSWAWICDRFEKSCDTGHGVNQLDCKF